MAGEDVDDEAHLLEAEPIELDSIEADAWASETESEPQEGPTKQKAALQDSTEGADAARLRIEGPAQCPPPAYKE